MRIDLITLHAVKNYGSVLQTFATQEKFKQFGHEVKVINFIREDVREENLMNTWCGNNYLKRVVLAPTLKRWRKVFNGFLKENINLTDDIYTTEEDFKKYPLEADIYCTGSDQVWNSGWNKGILPQLYLSFVPKENKKFSYAASFGSDSIRKEEVEITKRYIDEYNAISVREESAIKILKDNYKYNNCLHVLDPTLAMTPKFWRKYSSKRLYDEEYILIYQLNNNKEFDKFAKELAKRNNLKLVRFCTRYDQIIKNGKSALVPEVFDFISLIDNAKYVITDSFHATAFSVNMNTEPICIYPKEYGGRIESFLNLTGLQERRLKNYNDFDIIKRKIDFNRVNEILNKEREKIDKFLELVFKS